MALTGCFFDTMKSTTMNTLATLSLLLILQLIILGYLLVWMKKLLLPLFHWGAIFVPSNDASTKTMIELAAPKPNETAIDLGSGDGKLVIAFAQKGVRTTGVEIDQKLVRISKKNIEKQNLQHLTNIKKSSFWKTDLSHYDIVVIYGMHHVMKRLKNKLEQELKPGARVITNAFKLPTWKETENKDGIYLYQR